MRVLFTAHGSHGHVLPVLHVAEAVRQAGHQVVVATGAQFCDLVASRGLVAHVAGLDDGELVAQARRRWPEATSQPPGTWTPRMFSEIAAPVMAADLAPFISRWLPDLVIREEGEHGGAIAAEATGIPWGTLGWGSPLPEGEARRYGVGVLDRCPPSLYGGRPPAVKRHPVRPASAGDAVRRSERERAYVGFGTVPLFRDAPDLMMAAAAALLSAGFDVTVTTSDPGLGHQLEGLDPSRVQVYEWVDLSAVVAGCRLVVCHGGAGTVLAALAAGVPLVLLPRGAPSQLRMSAACETRGVGRVVEWRSTNTDEVAAAVVEVGSNPRFGDAAKEVAREIARMPDAADAATELIEVAAGAL